MKKILIIGGTGFLGFSVSKSLVKKYKIYSISLSPPKKYRKHKKIKYLLADISKIKSINKIKKHISDIKYVINFGGYVIHDNKRKVFETHYLGAKNLMNFYLRKKINLFLQIGSSMEYGKTPSPQQEESISKPTSDYGKAKLLATNYAKKLFKLHNFPAVVFRLYQIYGPHQDNNRLIPFIIEKCLNNESFPCSSGKQYRDFLFIDDFTKCIKKSLNNKKIIGKVFNIGYGRPEKVKKVIVSINKKIKKGYADFGKIKLKKGESKIVFPKIDKIKKTLNWKAKIYLDEGIEKTIYFFKKNMGV